MNASNLHLPRDGGNKYSITICHDFIVIDKYKLITEEPSSQTHVGYIIITHFCPVSRLKVNNMILGAKKV